RIPGYHHGEVGGCSVRLASQTAFLSPRRVKRVWILALAGLLASCPAPNPSPKISPPPESFSELKQRIALIRELPFKREVSLANESPQRLPKEFFLTSTGQSPSTPLKDFLSCLLESDNGRLRSSPGLPSSAFPSVLGRKTPRPFVEQAKHPRKSFR